MTFYVHAPNVHQGGGRTLLSTLLTQADQNFHLVLDSRMTTNLLPQSVPIKSIKPTLFDRFKAEVWLYQSAKSNDHILCFGNLPPLFKTHAKVSVFLQNRYLFGQHDFSKFSTAAKLRLQVERWWFRARMQSNYQVIVQSQSMQRELKQTLGFDSLVLAFSPDRKSMQVGAELLDCEDKFDFVYVSSAEPHKNHFNLLSAWVLLAKQGVRPSLALTVSENTAAHVAQLIEHTKQLHGLNVKNFGTLQHGQVQALYQNSSALIFPSKLESYGLPLLEAKQLGMPILAPELDYVRDVVQPDQTFNPDSPTSIARAVLRHLNIQTPTVEPVDAATFLAHIQKQGEA